MTDGWYKCDRCGEFERGPIRRCMAGTDYADSKYRRIQFGHLTGEDGSGSKTRIVDLCHDCRKSLTDWVEQEAADA